jgi:hypothetical protein
VRVAPVCDGAVAESWRRFGDCGEQLTKPRREEAAGREATVFGRSSASQEVVTTAPCG